MRDWSEIQGWRKDTRARLLSRRQALGRPERDRVQAIVADLLLRHIPELRAACIGFCWPFKGELDLRGLVSDCIAAGATAALPVVIERARPLEYRAWSPRAKLERGVWGIPVPTERRVARPTILLAPLVGFDNAGYRLGYGGGYHDRTLAALEPRPLAIGVGYELGRLDTIHPQAHDIAMDAIATEAGFTWFRAGKDIGRDAGASAADDAAPSFASPPCALHELEPAARGFLSHTETLELLCELLEAERAGARAVSAMSRESIAENRHTLLRRVAMDEARYCAMLTQQIVRLGGTPTLATGAFYEKLLATKEPDRRLDLLSRGQAWVVRKIREALPRIADDALHRGLKEMLEVHERNVAGCVALQQQASAAVSLGE
jgi:5-formyltetrahydrofolate cyclo-ligase